MPAPRFAWKYPMPAAAWRISSTLPTPTLFLPSGRYRIESQYGWHNARQTREIDVSAADVLDAMAKARIDYYAPKPRCTPDESFRKNEGPGGRGCQGR